MITQFIITAPLETKSLDYKETNQVAYKHHDFLKHESQFVWNRKFDMYNKNHYHKRSRDLSNVTKKIIRDANHCWMHWLLKHKCELSGIVVDIE